MGAPLPPFEQLLCVLPPDDSLNLLPAPYRDLVGSPQLAPYFPSRVRIDNEGKRNPWEFIVLVPFFEWSSVENYVRQAVPPERLTQEERQRNLFGPAWRFQYSRDCSQMYTYPSTLPSVFPDIEDCHVVCEPMTSAVQNPL